MKHCFILVFFFSTLLYSRTLEHIRWHWDYDRALIEAKQKHKPIMLFLQKKNSKESKKMLFTTLCNQSYIKDINQKYISIVLFFEEKNLYPSELFYPESLPAVFFIDSKNESLLINPIFGYMPPDQFRILLENLNKKKI